MAGQRLRILVVGGTSTRQFHGDKNAPLEIATALRRHAEVVHLPLQDDSRRRYEPKTGVMPRRPQPLDLIRVLGRLPVAWKQAQGSKGLRARLLNSAICALDAVMATRAIKKFRPDVVHIHGDELKSVPVIQACIQARVPFIVTVHLLYALTDVSRNWDTSRQPDILRWAQRAGGHITFVSSANRRTAIDTFKLDPSATHVVLNGCHLRDPAPPEAADAVLQVGSLNPRKNHIEVLDALAAMPSDRRPRFWIVGDGPQRDRLEEAAKRWGIQDCVSFLGRVPQDQLDDLYRRAGGLILPSLSEGLALVVLEALSYGRPVAMFDDLDGAEDLHDRKAVHLVPRGREGLIDALLWLTSGQHDPVRIQQQARALSWDAAARDYLAVMRLLMADPLPPTQRAPI